MTETTEVEQDVIVLEIGERDIRFSKRKAEAKYSAYINQMAGKKLTKASHNYCVDTVIEEDHASLRAILNSNKGAALQIGGMLSDEVAPELEIRVKKR